MFRTISSKKAQGLPLNFIVLAAIAVLILILIVAFVVSGGGSLLSQLMAPQATSKETVVNACQTACDRLAVISTKVQFTTSGYCTKSYSLDLDGSGKIDTDDERGIKCWNTDINVGCSVSFTASEGAVTCSMAAGDTEDSCTDACTE